jgi:tripartite-type tricarboxylate transporter receptor subunit TctC
VPSIADFVPGFETSTWVGIGAPRNTPAAIIERLNIEINAALTDPKLETRFAELGATILSGSTADFAKLIADETEKWGKVVKFSGMKLE